MPPIQQNEGPKSTGNWYVDRPRPYTIKNVTGECTVGAVDTQLTTAMDSEPPQAVLPPIIDESSRKSNQLRQANQLHQDSTSNHGAASTSEHLDVESQVVPPAKAWMASDAEQAAPPKNNMLLVMPSICLVLFLVALDQTIVATALPTIASQFGATNSEYGWVGTSYLLSSLVLSPLWGRLTDMVGRREVLYPGIVVFTIGSALCGASQSMKMLIASRALQGVGGGSILSLTQILIGDIVELPKRGLYNGFLGGIWGLAAVLGPISGGLLTEKATWRWCFFINLPTCAIALACLFFTLKLNPRPLVTWQTFKQCFDFLGLALLMSGSALLVVGFAFASDYGWNSASTIACLVVAVVLIAASGVNFLTTKRNAIIPRRALTTRTTGFFLIASTLHGMAFLASSYYFPVFFQGVKGASPLMSGVYLLPFSLIVAMGTVVSGQINSRFHIIRPVVWVGYAVAALGYGLSSKYLAYGSSLAAQEIVLVVCAIGVGVSLSVPLLIIQAAMPLKEMAASTSAWVLTRSLGGTLGIAVFQAVLSNQLESRFPRLEGFGTDFGIPQGAAGYTALHALPEGAKKDEALTAFSDSMRTLYLTWMPFFIVAFVISLFTKHYTMDRKSGTSKSPPSVQEEPVHGIQLDARTEAEEGASPPKDNNGGATVPEPAKTTS